MKRLFLLISLSIFFVACANKSMTRYEELSEPLEKGGFPAAIDKVVKKQDDLYGSNSEFLYHFDLATLYHYNGDWKKSADEFEKAKQVYEDLYTRSVSNEAAAVLTNDNMRPYRARPFEVLALYEMNIINYLAMKDIDGALVEVRAADIALQQLYQKNNKKVNDAGFLRYLIAIVYDMEGEKDDAAISYYKTAQAYEEDPCKLPAEAQAFIADYLKQRGREDDLKSLKFPNSGTVQTPEAARNANGEIIVVGYAGHSAILGEWMLSGTYVRGGVLNLMGKSAETGKVESITLPAPAISTSARGGTTVSITIALPERKSIKSQVHNLEVKLDDYPGIFKPEVVADISKNLDKNLSEEKSTTLTRTAIRVATRTFAAQEAKKAMETDNVWLNLLTNIGTDVAAAQMEQADLRVGLFLPNDIRMSRLPAAPGMHKVSVIAANEYGNAVKRFDYTVNVKPGNKAWIVVPAIK